MGRAVAAVEVVRRGATRCAPLGLDVAGAAVEIRRVLQMILLISRGLIRSQHTRRVLMFYTVLVAMLMLFLGATFLQGWLRENPLLLVAYWFLCGSLTIFSALLAVFDILVLRALARAEKRLERALEEARRQQAEE